MRVKILDGLAPFVIFFLPICGYNIKLPDVSQLNYTKFGDFMLGLVAPVHAPELGTTRCAPAVRDLGMLQRLEALVYAVEEVNNSTAILPNHTLGYSIFDDCYRDTIALAQTLHFSYVEPRIEPTPSPPGTCPRHADPSRRLPPQCMFTLHLVDVVGVIGSESSSASQSMAQLLTTFQKPQLSYLSTAPILSDNNRFPHFSRVVSSDLVQAKVIIQLLNQFEWTYVSMVYAEGSYGTGAHKALRSVIADIKNVCFSQEYEIKEDFGPTDYRHVVSNIIGEPRSRVVITFVPDYIGRHLLFWADFLLHEGKITWIAADAWLRDPELISMGQGTAGLARVAKGALSVNIRSSRVPRFDEHFRQLEAASYTLNPWINNYLMQYHNCSNDTCSTGLRIADHPEYAPETTTSLAFDAVYAFAHALDQKVRECGDGLRGDAAAFNECMRANLTLSIRQLNVQWEGGTPIRFDENGDRASVYDVYNVQEVNATYRLVRVAEWHPVIGELYFLGAPIQWPRGQPPVSRCSAQCAVGEARSLEEKRCCWSCVVCEPSQIVTKNRFDVERCVACGNESWPDEESRTACEPIVAVYVRWSDPVGVALTALASVGIVASLLLTAVFIINNKHPLIKASDRELSYTMMAGIIVSFGFVFVFIMPPTWQTCTTSLFGSGISFTLIYAPLMLKLIRIWRIFHAGRNMSRNPRFVDSKSQMIACAILVVVVGLMVIPWVYKTQSPMVAEIESDKPGMRERVCIFPHGPFITAIGVNVCFLVVCSVFAFKNRTLPVNFNESRFAAFFVYSTCVLWLAFVPAYFLTKTGHRIIFLCVMLIGNAVVCLCGMYVPKVYAVYFLQENNLHIVGVKNVLRAPGQSAGGRAASQWAQFLDEEGHAGPSGATGAMDEQGEATSDAPRPMKSKSDNTASSSEKRITIKGRDQDARKDVGDTNKSDTTRRIMKNGGNHEKVTIKQKGLPKPSKFNNVELASRNKEVSSATKRSCDTQRSKIQAASSVKIVHQEDAQGKSGHPSCSEMTPVEPIEIIASQSKEPQATSTRTTTSRNVTNGQRPILQQPNTLRGGSHASNTSSTRNSISTAGKH